MADRTPAEIYGNAFAVLAEHVIASPEEKSLLSVANVLWAQCDGYDFSPHQMHCDEALVTLGLARVSKRQFVHKNGIVDLGDVVYAPPRDDGTWTHIEHDSDARE